MWIDDEPGDSLMSSFEERLRTRFAAAPAADPETGEIIVDRNEMIGDEAVERLKASRVTRVLVRSPLVCEVRRGVCRMCYGVSLATMKPVIMGEAVGIIAAQSIGEPGTQLTMRTFHTGGIAAVDITSGLPRVEEAVRGEVSQGGGGAVGDRRHRGRCGVGGGAHHHRLQRRGLHRRVSAAEGVRAKSRGR